MKEQRQEAVKQEAVKQGQEGEQEKLLGQLLERAASETGPV